MCCALKIERKTRGENRGIFEKHTWLFDTCWFPNITLTPSNKSSPKESTGRLLRPVELGKFRVVTPGLLCWSWVHDACPWHSLTTKTAILWHCDCPGARNVAVFVAICSHLRERVSALRLDLHWLVRFFHDSDCDVCAEMSVHCRVARPRIMHHQCCLLQCMRRFPCNSLP